MDRNYTLFPNDENGDVLWHLRNRGDALTHPREIDVTAILPSEEAAIDLATVCLRNGFLSDCGTGLLVAGGVSRHGLRPVNATSSPP
jgi:hypothetical protein